MALVIVVVSCSRDAQAKEIHAADFNADGLQTSFTRVRGSDRNGELVAVGFAMSRAGFGFEKGIAVRVLNTASLALGAKGIQGGLYSAVAGGLRLPIAETHGIVIRAGLEGSFFGNKYLWDSMLEIPQVHLGYQWLEPQSSVVGARRDQRLVDVAVKSGYIVLGRHDTGDAGWRTLSGAPEAGAIAALHVGAVDMRAMYTRIFARHGGDPVDQLEGALCGQAKAIVVCDALRFEVGDVRVPASGVYRSSQVSFIGLTIGLAKPKGRLD